MEEQTIIHISDDFDMDRVAESGQCFRWEKAEPDTYRILAGRSCLYMKALGEDPGQKLEVSGSVDFADVISQARERAKNAAQNSSDN